MRMEFSPEQHELRAAIRGFLTARAPMSRQRELIAAGRRHDDELWQALASEIGAQSLIIPERHGGAGGSLIDLSIVMEEVGRTLAVVSLLPTALASLAILGSGDEPAASRYLPQLASGEAIGCLALADDDGRWCATTGSVTAHEAASGWRLNGCRSYVAGGQAASLIVVPAVVSDRMALFVVTAEATGVDRRQLPDLTDPTMPLSQITFDDSPAHRLGGAVPLDRAFERLLDIAAVLLACEQVGGAARCLQMSLDHVMTRTQFDRLVGSFQAVKHRCADMLLDVEMAKSAAYYGVRCAEAGSDELATVASLARAFCSAAYSRVAASNLQNHGGIGFTWECDAHLYLKRAKSSEVLFGNVAFHQDQLVARVGL